MKTLKYIAALAIAGMSASCVDDFKVGNAFLEKAPGVDVNMDSVFQKAEYTRNFLWTAYGQLYCTYTSGNCMNGAPIDALSDSWHCYCSWGGPKQTYYGGNLSENAQDTDDGNLQGRFAYSTHNDHGSSASGRVSIYETIRKCWQIIENIDRVPDMSAEEKSRLRGEAYIIIASRYFDAFRNFGGLCLVDHAFAVGEDFKDGRATAMQTVEFIDDLIQKAIDEPGLPWNVADEDIDQWSGRLTEASARALRCKLWMFAASPLFNSDQPYMQYDESKVTEFTNIEHVWFGKYDPQLWQRCLQACDDFFAENDKHGSYYQLVMPTGTDEAAYRKAFRAGYRQRNDHTNHEKLFDVHPTYNMGSEWGWQGFAIDCVRQGGLVPTNELMEMFGMADGRNYPYADMDIYGPGKNPGGIDIFADRDPRLYETMVVPREYCAQVEDYKGLTSQQTWYNGNFQNNNDMNSNADNCASGYMMFKWVIDYWKITNTPVGIPYIRLAEVYLIRAEARAETGNLTGALADVNLIRSRVGLGAIEKMNPQLSLTSNKDNLIAEILRERNCEIGAECGDRFYDMIRRKLEKDFTKPLHEMVIYRLNADGSRDMRSDTRLEEGEPWPKFEYERPVIITGARRWWDAGYWTNKWYLDPVSRNEIQKGYGLTQNPGW